MLSQNVHVALTRVCEYKNIFVFLFRFRTEMSLSCYEKLFNSFWPNFPFYILKTSENQRFSEKFRGYRNGTFS